MARTDNPWDSMTTFAPKSCVEFFTKLQLGDLAEKERRLRARLPAALPAAPPPVLNEDPVDALLWRWTMEDVKAEAQRAVVPPVPSPSPGRKQS